MVCVVLSLPLVLACDSDSNGLTVGDEAPKGVRIRGRDQSLGDLVRSATAVGVFRIDAIESVDFAPTRGRFPTLYTTYRTSPLRWIRGEGTEQVLITKFGGIHPETGEIETSDGSFLLEVGEDYLLILDRKPAGAPGNGEYWPEHGGRGNFQVTDGRVHVLNHPLAKDISDEYNGKSLDDFVQVIAEFASLPSVPPTEQPTAR